MIRSPVLVLWMILAVSVSAQRTGTVRLFVDPGNDYSFVLDGKYRMQERELTLSEGQHTFTLWAPQRAMVDTTFDVIRDSLSVLTVRLPYSVEYVAYTQELSRYRKENFLTRSIPAVVTLGLGIWSGIQYGNYRSAYNDLNALNDSYADLSVPRQITELKQEQIPAAQDELGQQRTLFFVSAGLFTAGVVGTWMAFQKTKTRAIPRFEDKEKLRFDGLVWIPGPQGGTWAAGLTIPVR